jgi:hypothetical protein
MKVYRAVLAVDHYDLLADARTVVGRHRNLILAGEAAIGIELLTLLSWMPADVAIFSVTAPTHRKREVIRIVANKYPTLKIFFIHHRIPVPSTRGVFHSSPWNNACEGVSARFAKFKTTGLQSNSHRQWEPLLIEH